MKIKIFFSLLACSTFLFGQDNAPLSQYGIGRINPTRNIVGKLMGDNLVAFRNEQFINSRNPASYTALQLTALETALNISAYTVKSASYSNNSSNAQVNNLSVGFPVAKFWGASFGIAPYAHSGYNLSARSYNPAIGEITSEINANGDVNAFHIGNAFKIKNISIGFNINYLFGKTENISLVQVSDSVLSTPFNTRITDNVSQNGLMAKFGVQYHTHFNIKNDSLIFTVGGTFQTASTLDAKQIKILESISGGVTSSFVRDSIGPYKQRGELTLPAEIGLGLWLEKKNKWGVGINYNQAGWSSFTNTLRERSPSLNDEQQLHIGGYFMNLGLAKRKDNTKKPLFKNWKYWYGINYKNTALLIDQNLINEFGINFGFSIPKYIRLYNGEKLIRRQLYPLNIGIGYTQTGTINANLIQENIFNITFGLLLNDKWFNKRKID